jgi:hypothetical protein
MREHLYVVLMILLCTSGLLAEIQKEAPSPTDTCSYSEKQRLEALLKNKEFRDYAMREFNVDPKIKANVIAYDHIYDTWAVYSWDGKTLTPYGDASPSGDTLKVELKPGRTAIMFATRSNPFFFRGTAKSITVADSDDVKQLETLAGLAGNFLKGFITVTAGNRSLAPEVLIQDETIENAATKLSKTTEELQKKAAALDEWQSQTLAYAQMIELRKKPKGTLPDIERMKCAPADVSRAAAGVRDAINELRELLDPYCPALVADATAALALMNSDAVEKAKSDVEAADRALSNAKPANRGARKKELNEKQAALDDALAVAKNNAVNMHATNPQCTQQPKSRELWVATTGIISDKSHKEGTDALEKIINVIGGGQKAVKLAGEALAKEPGALKVAAWLADSADIAEAYGLRDTKAAPPCADAPTTSQAPATAAAPTTSEAPATADPCRYIDSPILVRGGSFIAKTGKKLSGGFTISKSIDTTNFHLEHPEPVERKVEVTATSKWGLGVGVVYTPLELESWKLEDKKVSNPTKETVSGQTALFANFHPSFATWRKASFGGQLGFNTSTEKPAIYGGVSLDLGKWLRLGTGYSFHRSKRLGEGVVEGQELPTGASLTEDYFPGAWYASLSLSLDGIPIFK